MDTTTTDPLELAKQVAAELGPEWGARQRDYRQHECAEIVNTDGATIWMTIMGNGGYTRANERGKVQFRASSDHELREHYAYRAEWPETMVTATRGPAAMAKAVAAKIVPAVVENNRVGRERRAEHEADARRAHLVAMRMAQAIGDDRDLDALAKSDPNTGSRHTVGSWATGLMIQAEVRGDQVNLDLRELPVELAERIVGVVKAYRDVPF